METYKNWDFQASIVIKFEDENLFTRMRKTSKKYRPHW